MSPSSKHCSREKDCLKNQLIYLAAANQRTQVGLALVHGARYSRHPTPPPHPRGRSRLTAGRMGGGPSLRTASPRRPEIGPRKSTRCVPNACRSYAARRRLPRGLSLASPLQRESLCERSVIRSGRTMSTFYRAERLRRFRGQSEKNGPRGSLA